MFILSLATTKEKWHIFNREFFAASLGYWPRGWTTNDYVSWTVLTFQLCTIWVTNKQELFGRSHKLWFFPQSLLEFRDEKVLSIWTVPEKLNNPQFFLRKLFPWNWANKVPLKKTIQTFKVWYMGAWRKNNHYRTRKMSTISDWTSKLSFFDECERTRKMFTFSDFCVGITTKTLFQRWKLNRRCLKITTIKEMTS